ncbi:Uncharacterised protein [Vibrio cholerae]|nr:Uncharacterised protein [Vibrio cholerae]CSC55428.1 Uncharacterised protein [Vibrio cholerae]
MISFEATTIATAIAVTESANSLISDCQSMNRASKVTVNTPFLVRDIHLRCFSVMSAASPRICSKTRRRTEITPNKINAVSSNLWVSKKSTAMLRCSISFSYYGLTRRFISWCCVSRNFNIESPCLTSAIPKLLAARQISS